jgi:hypothetical protein
VILFVQWSCEYLAAPNIACSLEKDIRKLDRGFQSCLTTWAETDRGIVRLRKLEFVGVGGLPIIYKLEPLEKTGPFQHFQMAFVTIPANL